MKSNIWEVHFWERCPSLIGGVAALVLSMPTALLAETRTIPSSFELGIELGSVWTPKNDVRVPGDIGTEFDMTALTGAGPEAGIRIDGAWQINEKHGVRAVLAPFEVSGIGDLPAETFFAGESFDAGRADATYKFSTYKLTYRYTFFDDNSWLWRVGFTGVIRDANIELAQGQIRANDADVGFVPALHLSSQYQISDSWRLVLDFDGLAGGPGRLIDLGVKADYAVGDRWRVGGGYRLLEGGVDIDDVNNFAWLNFLVFDARYMF